MLQPSEEYNGDGLRKMTAGSAFWCGPGLTGEVVQRRRGPNRMRRGGRGFLWRGGRGFLWRGGVPSLCGAAYEQV